MGQGLRPKGLAQCQLEVTIGYETGGVGVAGILTRKLGQVQRQ